jgi:hypothetical protein
VNAFGKWMSVAAVASTTLLLLGCGAGRSGSTPGQTRTTKKPVRARTVRMEDIVRTHVTSRQGTALVIEGGYLSGTVPGHIELETNVLRRRATFQVVTHSGIFEGYAVVAEHRLSWSHAGFYVHTTDNAYVTHGSGAYAHAYSTRLLISGGFLIAGDHATYHVDGTISY